MHGGASPGRADDGNRQWEVKMRLLVMTDAGRGAASTASRAKRKWLAMMPLAVFALLAPPWAHAADKPTTTHEPSVRIATTDREIDQAIREVQDDTNTGCGRIAIPTPSHGSDRVRIGWTASADSPNDGNAYLCRQRLSAGRVEALDNHTSRLATCGREHGDCMDEHSACLEEHNACARGHQGSPALHEQQRGRGGVQAMHSAAGEGEDGLRRE